MHLKNVEKWLHKKIIYVCIFKILKIMIEIENMRLKWIPSYFSKRTKGLPNSKFEVLKPIRISQYQGLSLVNVWISFRAEDIDNLCKGLEILLLILIRFKWILNMLHAINFRSVPIPIIRRVLSDNQKLFDLIYL